MLRKLVIGSLFFFLTSQALPNDWQTIQPGLSYRYFSPHLIPTSASSVYAFRFDLSRYELKLLSAKQFGLKATYADQFVKKSGAILAINGGFFSPEKRPLGLRLQNGKVLNPLRRISWWGVFYVKGQQPYIVPMKHFKNESGIRFAVQSGPRLLVNGRKTKLLPGRDFRSALCIDEKKRVIIAATNNLPLTTTQFADVLKEFGCVDALNLDGGSSTQLYINTKDYTFNVMSFRPVADAVAVFSR